MKKVESLEHAQQIMGVELNLDTFKSLGIPEKDVQPLQDQYKLWFITEANNKLNEWVCDWSDRRQPKYSIWAPAVVANTERPSGFGLAFNGTRYWYTNTLVGARLNVGSYEEAKYIFEDFIELWDSAWLIQTK
jgi:hypothetical protein